MRGRSPTVPVACSPRARKFDPLCDLVGSFIRARFPVGPGHVVFGKPVERRVVHSIRTLSIETKLHPIRLRKLVEAANLLPEGSAELVDANCLFDAVRGSQAARDAAAATLSVLKAGEYLNAPRVQRNLLHRSGIIVPRIRGNGAADQFAPEDLDMFLTTLLDGAKPAATAGADRVNIPDAAKLACCGSIELRPAGTARCSENGSSPANAAKVPAARS